MSGIIERFFKNYCPVCKIDEKTGGDTAYLIFRIIVALSFFQYGLQKIFGLLGGVDGAGATVTFGSLVFWAGIIELAAGAGIALGIFTRFLALVSAVEMAYAYLFVHFPNGLFPILNGGGMALMFFAAFLLILKHGSGKGSLEKAVLGREVF
jgi:putative oxidoreductase